MEVESWLSIGLFIFLILLSAFFSGSESAYFSLSQIELQGLKEERKKSRSVKRILHLMEKPRLLLMSILIGNTIVNVAAATVAALFQSNDSRRAWFRAQCNSVGNHRRHIGHPDF